MRTKICTKCKKRKLIKYFYKAKHHSDGLDSHCKKCRNIYFAIYRKKNKFYYKQWYKKHKEEQQKKARKYSKQYYEKNKKKIKIYYKKHNKKSKVKNEEIRYCKNEEKII